MIKEIKTHLKNYLPYLLLIVVLYFAFFWRLNGALLWRDEATTACWARVVAKSNSLIPKVVDGEQLIVQGSKGHDFNENFSPSMQGWLQFYIGALVFKILGVNTFTARLPFVLLGIIGIFLFYLIFKLLFDSKRLAFIATFLCSLSLPYLHYARQSRYYALVLLISLALIYEMSKYLKDPEKYHSYSFFIRVGIYGILLFFSNYFTFGIFWVGLLLAIPIVREKRFTLGLLSTTIVISALIVPVMIIVHSSFISRSEIANFTYLSDYWDWLLLSFRRVNYLLPLIPLFLIGIFVLWRYPQHTGSHRKLIVWLWSVLISTLVVSVILNKSNAFLRYYLHVIPIAMILIGVYTYWAKAIFGKTVALILFAILFIYHSWTPILNHSEAVVKRQFMKDDSVSQPMIEFLRENVKPRESVAFITNDKGMVAYFYLPYLKWYGILESTNPYNQVYKTKLIQGMFDDYSEIDWVVVWAVQGLPARVEIGY
ncbi:MAG: glycosyltransferase family 39 protein, partial [bacterium]